MGGILKHKVRIGWSPNFAYAIGLIASDGCLHKDGRHVLFASKDREMMENFKSALDLDSVIMPHARGGEIEKKYFQLSFSDKIFHEYLQTIGLTPKKSKTIQSVTVPDKYFADFLRGLFDGDGSFYTFWDTRWPNSFGYKITIASASKDFLVWLKEKLTALYGVHGHIKGGIGMYEIRYVKGDSKELFRRMYGRKGTLFLRRKYEKMADAFGLDERIKTDYSVNRRLLTEVVMPR